MPDLRSMPLRDFYDRIAGPQIHRSANRAQQLKFAMAINRLGDFLGRAPTVADLDGETPLKALLWLQSDGYSRSYRDKFRYAVNRLADHAHRLRLIADPKPIRCRIRSDPRPEPYRLEDLSRLIAAARSMPEDPLETDLRFWHEAHRGIPSAVFWPALLMTILDTAEGPRAVLQLPVDALDGPDGRLTIGPAVVRLHEPTVEALQLVAEHRPADESRLLPWTLDRGGRSVPNMLYRRFKHILHRAGLSIDRANLFERLRITAEAMPDAVARIDPAIPFEPQEGRPDLDARRNRRRRSGRKARFQVGRRTYRCRIAPWAVESHRQRPSNAGEDPPPVFIIRNSSERTLRHFFETRYRPIRLSGRSEQAAQEHRRTITLLSWFTATDVTVDELSEDLLEGFRVWLSERGYEPVTTKGMMGRLCAQWRYAWRKRLIDDLPRDVEMPQIPKRVPECWSQAEFARILDAAAQTPGRVGRVPASTWWPAFLLVLYDTGLRVGALLSVRLSDVDLEDGWLNCPAEFQKQYAQQVFRLHMETVELLRQFPADRETLLDCPHGEQWLQKRYSRILKRAGLPHGKRDKFHKVRRTSGTYVADAAGEEAARQHLGHSTIHMTRAHYLDRRFIRHQVHAADVLPRPWRENGDEDSDQ